MLSLLLTGLGIPHKIVRLIKALYSQSVVSCVRASHLTVLGSQLNLEFDKGACWHQTLSLLAWTDCWKDMLAQPRMEFHFSDLDFADDVTLLAKLLELSHYKELK